jgi:mRNA-degrading endonuclease RelE of RelBE toxin-antitoxin system
MVSYNLLIAQQAKRSLGNLPDEPQESLHAVLEDVAASEQPTHHAKAKQMGNQRGMFRIRVGDYRAVCELDKPDLLVHRVGKRPNVYDSVDDIRA